ncbi:sulfur carrier protein ThiS [Lachnospiraceae bacterium 47-T17]
MVKINGEQFDAAGTALAEFLEREGYDNSRLAVERNGAIVPKAQYGSTMLGDGDELEIVSFVGGG